MEDDEGASSSIVEQTIATMEMSQLCTHPLHHHSFSQVGFLIAGSMRVCVACGQRLRSVLGYGGDTNNQVVRCMACYAYAHRSCALLSPDSPRKSMWDNKHCKVNTPTAAQIINKTEQPKATDPPDARLNEEKKNSHNRVVEKSNDEMEEATKQPQQTEVESEDEAHGSFLHVLPDSRLPAPVPAKTISEDSDGFIVEDEVVSEENGFVWTDEGPPRHWAAADFSISNSAEDDKGETSDKEDEPKTLEINNNTFRKVATALQENVLAHFHIPSAAGYLPLSDNETEVSSVDSRSELVVVEKGDDSKERGSSRETEDDNRSDTASSADVQCLLDEVKVNAPPTSAEKVLKLAKDGIKVSKTSVKMRRKLGIVTVAGGIVGGVAGLCVAGPASAVVGAKFGQTAGAIGVLLEGSLTVGVIVAGAAAGSFTARQIQQQHDQRILTIGEEGSKQKLLLVRPHVSIDPIWEEIWAEAKRSAPENKSNIIPFPLGAKSPAQQAQEAKKQRYQRDSDIVGTEEFELATEEKVLLLVSRILNDKLSLPGHVYRTLLQVHRDRTKQYPLDDLPMESAQETEADSSSDAETNKRTRRSRRQDAHAVIKHVTATLLEVRPGFGSSPAITEMSATAVEDLVFADLYHSVYEEIVEETREVDASLMAKIMEFDNAHKEPNWDEISMDALKALAMIPEAKSPSDKLRLSVRFLELISEHFSAPRSKAVGADSLLKMACQHIVVAKVPHMNAEIGFLEEFARDEQLLRGKEGYALVTLQASMHFLNASNDFDREIFFLAED